MLAVSIILRLSFCAFVTWLAWRAIGNVAFATCAPLFGALLARPLIDAFSNARQVLREQALKGIAGRHYAYRGNPVDVIQDGACQRWLRTADVRRIVRDLPDDAVLHRVYPSACMRAGRPETLYLLDAALADFLGKAREVGTRSFLRWLQRDVIFPAQRLRERARPVDRDA